MNSILLVIFLDKNEAVGISHTHSAIFFLISIRLNDSDSMYEISHNISCLQAWAFVSNMTILFALIMIDGLITMLLDASYLSES